MPAYSYLKRGTQKWNAYSTIEMSLPYAGGSAVHTLPTAEAAATLCITTPLSGMSYYRVCLFVGLSVGRSVGRLACGMRSSRYELQLQLTALGQYSVSFSYSGMCSVIVDGTK